MPRLSRCYLKHVLTNNKIYLSDAEEIIIGRNKTSSIKHAGVSRNHFKIRADFNKRILHVISQGRNLSGCNGLLLLRNKEYIIENGSVLEVLIGCTDLQYKICFEDQNSENKEQKVKHQTKIFGNIDKPDSSKWEKLDGNELLVFSSPGIESKSKVAAFDVDGTIITTQSGAVFPKDINDWKFLFSNVPQKLRELHEDGYKIVCFTNQAGIKQVSSKAAEFEKKMFNVVSKLQVPLQIFAATGKSIYRKPLIEMWNVFTQFKNESVKVDISNSFYVGDAAGRPKNWEPKKRKDHSNSDRLFALNVGLKFLTPEEFFLGSRTPKFQMPEFDPRNLPKNTKPIQLSDTQEVIILVGSPGSGKTHYVKNFILPHGYVHVNRDKLGTWQKCVQLMENKLKDKCSIVIDNTNKNVEARKRYIEIAKAYNVPCRCFWMRASLKQCLHNNKFRELFDKNSTHVNDIVIHSYWKEFQEPTLNEDFSRIERIDFVPSFENNDLERKYKMFLLES